MSMSLNEEARAILEAGNIMAFMAFYKDNKNNVQLHKSFPDDDDVSFPMILVQTFRKMEATRVESTPISVEEYIECLQMMKVQANANLDFQDESGRTVCHWCVLLQSQTLLGEALNLGCDPLIQDQEGQTIVHLAVRLGCQQSLETIKNNTLTSAVFEEASSCSGATPLIYATQIGTLETAKKLVQLNVDPNRQENNKYKRTALHYALFTNRLDIFEELLKAGAKPNIPDYNKKTILDRVAKYPNEKYLRLTALYSSGEVFSTIDQNDVDKVTPLMAACQNDDTETVDQLLDKGIDTELTDEDARTALHHCAEHRNTACAGRLITKNSNLVHMKDRNGFTTLHLATVSGNIPLMTHLLERGAEIDCLDNEGHTCLHWAVVCCQLEAIDLLISREASLSLPDDYGAHPLHYATQAFASPEGDLKGPAVLRRLLNHNCPVDCMDREDRTPFLWASSLGVHECCEMLKESGANLNHRDKAGLTALHCAASRGQYETIDLLLEKFHMDLNCEDNNGCSPLFYAVTLKHMPIVELLLSKNCNPNHQDHHGRSPMHCAAVKGQVDILDILEKSGGNLWIKNDKEVFPLHEACETSNLEVAKYILNHNTEEDNIEKVNEFTSLGYTCLHLAAEAGSVPICELIIENGAEVNIITHSDDETGKTALNLAANDDVRDVLKNNGAISAEVIYRKIAEEEAARVAEEEAAALAALENAENLEENDPDNIEYQEAEGDQTTGETESNESVAGDTTPSGQQLLSPTGSPVKSSDSQSPAKSSSSKGDGSPARRKNGMDSSDLLSPASPVKHARFSKSAQIPTVKPGAQPLHTANKNSSNVGRGQPVARDNKGLYPPRSGSQGRGTGPAGVNGYQRNVSRLNSRPASKAPPGGNKSILPGRAVSSGNVRPGGYRNGGMSDSLLPQIGGTGQRRAGSDTSSVSTLRNVRPQVQTAPASLENFRGAGGFPGKKKKNTISSEITESVQQFENTRVRMREMAQKKRMEIFNGCVSDKAMMEALKQEYQRNYLLSHINQPRSNSSPRLAKSDVSSENPESLSETPREPLAPDDELESNIRRTRELYEEVQRQADKTLRQARQINTALCDDLQKKRIAAYANTTRKSRPTTTIRKTVPNQQRPISVVMSEHIRHERLKKAYSSPTKDSSKSMTQQTTSEPSEGELNYPQLKSSETVNTTAQSDK